MALGKKGKIALLALPALAVLAALLAAVAGPRLADALLAGLESLALSQTGRPLSLARPPSLSLLPPGLSFEGLRWGDESSPLSLSARSGRAQLRLSSLFGPVPEIEELRLEGPQIRLREAGSVPSAASPSGSAASPSNSIRPGEPQGRQGGEPPSSGLQAPSLLHSRLLRPDAYTVALEIEGTALS